MQGFLCDIRHFWVVDAAVVKCLKDGQPKGKGSDVQHARQCGFLGSRFVSSPNQLHITHHSGFQWCPGDFSGVA